MIFARHKLSDKIKYVIYTFVRGDGMESQDNFNTKEEEQNMYTNNQTYRRLDFGKIRNRNTKIVSSEEALKDIKPIEWSEDVLNGKRKVTIKKQ